MKTRGQDRCFLTIWIAAGLVTESPARPELCVVEAGMCYKGYERNLLERRAGFAPIPVSRRGSTSQ